MSPRSNSKAKVTDKQIPIGQTNEKKYLKVKISKFEISAGAICNAISQVIF